MTGKSYYKRPHRVRAIQFDGSNLNDVEEFSGIDIEDEYLLDPINPEIYINGLTVELHIGDYIVDFGDSQNDLFHIMKPDLFDAIYQENKSDA